MIYDEYEPEEFFLSGDDTGEKIFISGIGEKIVNHLFEECSEENKALRIVPGLTIEVFRKFVDGKLVEEEVSSNVKTMWN